MAKNESKGAGDSGKQRSQVASSVPVGKPATTASQRDLGETETWRARGPTELPPQFGRYRVMKKLGGGGMGTVYLVENTELEREEALKVPHFGDGDDPQLRERFLREAKSAARLDHANLCPVYDAGVQDGIYYLTMRFLKGKLLSDFVGKAQPERKAVEVVARLAQALESAHGKGVIHRDLKPSNIMMVGASPVVMDFGLAKQVRQPDQKLTQDGSMLGTPAYMPPEQLKGELERMGPASDVYSLGVILYELLTGRLPFEGTTAVIFGQILHTEPPLPSALVPGLNPTLDGICRKAMAKDSTERFPSMKAFAAALFDFLRATPATQSAGNLVPTAVDKAVFQAATVAPQRRPAGDNGIFQLATVAPQARRSLPPMPAETQARETQPRETQPPSATRPHQIARTTIETTGTGDEGPSQRKFIIGLALSAALALVAIGIGFWAGGAIRVRTADGTLVVEVNEPNPDVYVDGERVAVTWQDGGMKAEIGVKPGTRKVELKKDGFSVYGDEVTLEDRGRKVLVARLEPNPPETPHEVATTDVASQGEADKQHFENASAGDGDLGPAGAVLPGSWTLVGPPGAWKATRAGVVLNDQVFTVEENGGLFATDPGTGDRRQIGQPEFATTLRMFAVNDALFTIEADGSLYQVDTNDGTWRRVGTEGVWVRTRAGAALDGQLYTVEENGELFVTNPANGQYRQIGNAVFGATTFMNAANGQLFTIETYGSLYRVDPNDGSWVGVGEAGAWKQTIATAVVNRKLVTAESDGTLQIANLDDGTRRQIGAAAFGNTVFMFALGGQVYTIEADGSLYRVFIEGQVTPRESKPREPDLKPHTPAELAAIQNADIDRGQSLRASTDPAEIAEIVDEVAPGFTAISPVIPGGVAIVAEHFGRPRVLSTHPLDAVRACILTSTFDVPADKKTSLTLDVSHSAAGDWQLVVLANGERLYDTAVGPTTAHDGWLAVSVDLTPFAGKQVVLELHNQATGYSHEWAFWDRVKITSREVEESHEPIPSDNVIPSQAPAKSAVVGSRPGEERNDNGLKLKLCWCPTGGKQGFWMGKFEVTQSEWAAQMGSMPSQAMNKGKGDRYPIYNVSLDDAIEFCRKLTSVERKAGRLPSGWSYRLPTEEQWEYACRAGTKTATAFGDKLSSTQANFNGDWPHNGAPKGPNLQTAVKVGSYRSNAWGIHDMHGNVKEFTTTPGRVRGGSWFDSGRNCCSEIWIPDPPNPSESIGFRVARVPSLELKRMSPPDPGANGAAETTGSETLSAGASTPPPLKVVVPAKRTMGLSQASLLDRSADTGLEVKEGQRIRLAVSGGVNLKSGKRRGPVKSGVDVIVCAIGQPAKRADQRVEGRAAMDFVATSSGNLFIGIADDSRADNEGSLTVEVRVE